MVLKGFINGAVSLELFKRSKIEQSKKIHKIYEKYTTDVRISNTSLQDEFMKLKEFMDKQFMIKLITNETK